MYGHMLSQLRRVQPKVVLALEGGYNPQLVGACAQSCIKVLLRGQDVSGDPELQELQGEDAYEPMPGRQPLLCPLPDDTCNCINKL